MNSIRLHILPLQVVQQGALPCFNNGDSWLIMGPLIQRLKNQKRFGEGKAWRGGDAGGEVQ
jgi:hypothetical protein